MYRVTQTPHQVLTSKLNSVRISGPLKVVPAPYEQSHGFRASSLHSCLRTTGYRLAKVAKTDETYNPDWALSADIGTTLHTRLQEQAVTSGLAVQYNGKPAIELSLDGCTLPALNPERIRLALSGHIDGVIRTTNGRLAIFDIKSTDAKYFNLEYPYLAEKRQHWASQMHAYMAYFAMPDGEQARVAFVYQVCRGDTSLRRLWSVPFQPDGWAADVARLTAAVASIQAGTLPTPEVERGCKFCDWRRLCESERKVG